MDQDFTEFAMLPDTSIVRIAFGNDSKTVKCSHIWRELDACLNILCDQKGMMFTVHRFTVCLFACFNLNFQSGREWGTS